MSKPKRVQIPKYTDDTVAYHINAILSAVDHIDDLLSQTQGDITQQILQEFPLKELPQTSFSLSEIHQRIKFLQNLSKEPQTKVQEVSISAHFQSILQVFSRLLKNEDYVKWFSYRVDETDGVPQYYNIIPCPMYFGAVAARIHATLLQQEENPMPIQHPTDEDLFLTFKVNEYGSLLTETVIKNDRRKRSHMDTELARASLESYKKLGKEFYTAITDKPQAYQSGQEILRDLLLIGYDCKMFNPQGPIYNTALKYLGDIKNSWTQERLVGFWPSWAEQVWLERELLDKQRAVQEGGVVKKSQIDPELILRVNTLLESSEVDCDKMLEFMRQRGINSEAPLEDYNVKDLEDLEQFLLGK
ncbi:hypothetical protein SS50377_28140 [Spironucleus salmonicida]|uniref:Uncharacterized protein n=1 Tax=Spironucleus salmonicida TaxID=348837 RepID=V6LPZ0_9EUKA|nr:hypothetical protein SS50377_28140 [Spironucleus salmonicida]|eukprot:EST42824.1 hypothetical protein SS50377_17593 [Spironucleus salmonicida]